MDLGAGKWPMGAHPLDLSNEQRQIGHGNWWMSSGQWAMGTGQWAVGSGQWAVGNGQWAVGNGKWSTGNGSGALTQDGQRNGHEY